MMKKKEKAFLFSSGIIFLAVIVAFYFYLKSVDRHYNNLIDTEIRTLHTLQAITGQSNRNYQLLYQALVTDTVPEQDSLLRLRNEGVARVDRQLDSLTITTPNQSSDDGHLQELISQRGDYTAFVQQYLELLRSDKSAAYHFLIQQLQPKFTAYQKAIESYFSYSKLTLLKKSANISEEIDNRSVVFLIIGMSPVLIISVLLLSGALVLFIFLKFVKGDE